MALTTAQQTDYDELTAFRKQLRAIIYSGATEITIDGTRMACDPSQARQSLRDIEVKLAAYDGVAPARPTVLSVSLTGNYGDDNSNQGT